MMSWKSINEIFNELGGLYELHGIRYGYSSTGTKIILNDPYQWSFSRMFIAITIAGFCSYFVFKLCKMLTELSEKDRHFLSYQQRYVLILLTILSLATSATHNTDNFVRVKDYFGAAFMYHGVFFILDIGLYFWVGVGSAAYFGVTSLLENPQASFASQCLYLLAIYFYCYMIWVAPIIHYSVERMSEYDHFANATICGEALFAAVLHCYCLYLGGLILWQKSSSNPEGTVEYQRLSTSEPAVDESGDSSTAVNSNGKSALRRRSRDNI
jgi:hypothetical protein